LLDWYSIMGNVSKKAKLALQAQSANAAASNPSVLGS